MSSKMYLGYTEEQILEHLEEIENLTVEEMKEKFRDKMDLVMAAIHYMKLTCHRPPIKRKSQH